MACLEKQCTPEFKVEDNFFDAFIEQIKDQAPIEQCKEEPVASDCVNDSITYCTNDSTVNWNKDLLTEHFQCITHNLEFIPDYWLYDKPAALFHYLNPILDYLCVQSEATEFLHPVDVKKLNIPDYYDIIKNPMDLSTIRRKLHTGQYKIAWNFIKDVWLMFYNAWSYNKKTTRVYKDCSKLADMFSSVINVPMKQLGYCCGQHYTFDPPILYCAMKQDCVIPKFASYWHYRNKYYVCKKCYCGTAGKTMVFQNSGQTVMVNKTDFVLKFNDELKEEPFVECIHCGIKRHKICSLYYEEMWTKGYLCPNCITNLGKKRLPNEFTSENLQKNKLDSYIEERVNNYLKSEGCDSKVIVRLIYNAKKSCCVKKEAGIKFVDTGIWPKEFPYSSKTLLVFQEIESHDVCIFSMFLQEYDSRCQQPNSRCVYISYLDSVNFFTPKELRTSVYHEILLGYLYYAKIRGFLKVYIWACPPKEGEDYVFYCHPKHQKTPDTKKLLGWYRAMLEKAICENIVKDYKDIYTQSVEDDLKNVSELPYFEGNFLPITLESLISNLEGNMESKGSCESVTDSKNEEKIVTKSKSKKSKKVTTKTKKGKKSVKSAKNIHCYSVGDPLTDRILLFLQFHKEVFFIIHLNHGPELPTVADPDPAISSDVMCTREAFLEFCRINDYEFSSLRRATYSTMVLLQELHKETLVEITCNHCENILKKGFHCTVCQDFDLCFSCYNLYDHAHPVEELKMNSDSKPSDSYMDWSSKFNPCLEHLCSCNDVWCPNSLCKEFKLYMKHYEACRMLKRQCQICSKFFPAIYGHSLSCWNINCLINSCKKIKRHLSYAQKLGSNHQCILKYLLHESETRKFLQNVNPDRKENSSSDFNLDNMSLFNKDFQSLPNMSLLTRTSSDAIYENQKSYGFFLPNDAIKCGNDTYDVNPTLTKCQNLYNHSNGIAISKIDSKIESKQILTSKCTVKLPKTVSVFDSLNTVQKEMSVPSLINNSFEFGNGIVKTNGTIDTEATAFTKRCLSASQLPIRCQDASSVFHPETGSHEFNHNSRENASFVLSGCKSNTNSVLSSEKCDLFASLKRKLSTEFEENQTQLPKSVANWDETPFPVQITKHNANGSSLHQRDDEISTSSMSNKYSTGMSKQCRQTSSDPSSFIPVKAPNVQSSVRNDDIFYASNPKEWCSGVSTNYQSLGYTSRSNMLTYVNNSKFTTHEEQKHLLPVIKTSVCDSSPLALSNKNNENIYVSNDFCKSGCPEIKQNVENTVRKSDIAHSSNLHVMVTKISNFLRCNSDASGSKESAQEQTSDQQKGNTLKFCQFKVLKHTDDSSKVYLTPVTSSTTSSHFTASHSDSGTKYFIPSKFRRVIHSLGSKHDSPRIKGIFRAKICPKKTSVSACGASSVVLVATESIKSSSSGWNSNRVEGSKVFSRIVNKHLENGSSVDVQAHKLDAVASDCFSGISFQNETPSSAGYEAFFSTSETKPPTVNAHHPSDFLNNNLQCYDNLEQHSSPSQLSCFEKNSGISASFQAHSTPTNLMDTCLFAANNTHCLQNNYLAGQLHRSDTVNQYCQEYFASHKNNISTNEKTLPNFESFGVCSYPKILQNKILPESSQPTSVNALASPWNALGQSVSAVDCNRSSDINSGSTSSYSRIEQPLSFVPSSIKSAVSDTSNLNLFSGAQSFNTSVNGLLEKECKMSKSAEPRFCSSPGQKSLSTFSGNVAIPMQSAVPMPETCSETPNYHNLDLQQGHMNSNAMNDQITPNAVAYQNAPDSVYSTYLSLDKIKNKIFYATSDLPTDIPSSVPEESGFFNRVPTVSLDDVSDFFNSENRQDLASRTLSFSSSDGSQKLFSRQSPNYSYNPQIPFSNNSSHLSSVQSHNFREKHSLGAPDPCLAKSPVAQNRLSIDSVASQATVFEEGASAAWKPRTPPSLFIDFPRRLSSTVKKQNQVKRKTTYSKRIRKKKAIK